jgi:hypothetical protein
MKKGLVDASSMLLILSCILSCVVCTTFEDAFKQEGFSVNVEAKGGPFSVGVDTKQGPHMRVHVDPATITEKTVSASVTGSLGPLHGTASVSTDGDMTVGVGVSKNVGTLGVSVDVQYTAPIQDVMEIVEHPFATEVDKLSRLLESMQQELETETTQLQRDEEALSLEIQTWEDTIQRIKTTLLQDANKLQEQVNNFNEFVDCKTTHKCRCSMPHNSAPYTVECCYADLCDYSCICADKDMPSAANQLTSKRQALDVRTNAYNSQMEAGLASFEQRLDTIGKRYKALDAKQRSYQQYVQMLLQTMSLQ